jgi:phosphate transport system protein
VNRFGILHHKGQKLAENLFIEIIGDLFRPSDFFCHIQIISDKAIQLNEEPKLKPYIDLPRMVELVGEMIRNSLDSFIRNDLNMAEEVRRMEEITDDLNEQIFRELLTFMMEDSKTIHRSLMIMQVSKNLERIADHAKGIADMVTYMVTGESVRHQTCALVEGEPA